MSAKRLLLVVLTVSLLLALSVGPRLAGPARALPPVEGPNAAGVTITYPGRLTNAASLPVTDGAYDFTFALYATVTDGDPLWTETQEEVTVQAGSFATSLGRVHSIPADVLAGGECWLAMGVRGPGESDFTALTPRQRLSAAATAAPANPAALTSGPACPHNHLGETWDWGSNTGNGLVLTGSVPWWNGLFIAINNSNGPSVWGKNYGGGNAVRGDGYGISIGVYGEGASAPGVAGRSASANGMEGIATADDKSGVYGETTSNYGGNGVYGKATTTTGYANGVLGRTYAPNGAGGRFYNDGNGVALWASGVGNGADKAALRVHNNSNTAGMAAYLTNSSGFATAHLQNSGNGEVLVLQSNGGRFIRAVDANWDPKFRLEGDGNAYADGNWNSGGADFAEMLPAVQGLEPGDVLVIGPDGQLTRSTEPYQASVAGVYSTKPGFVGGQPVEGEVAGAIPLAVVGVVPVKASAENGPIRPGDLLTASSTPGYAMKASPLTVNGVTFYPGGVIIGKALQGLDDGTGVIQVLVTLQ
jgi:hypothetical protein